MRSRRSNRMRGRWAERYLLRNEPAEALLLVREQVREHARRGLHGLQVPADRVQLTPPGSWLSTRRRFRPERALRPRPRT